MAELEPKKRRLPVLQDPGGDDEIPDRPPWHWSGMGMIAIFLAWLPLASALNAILGRALRSDPAASGAAVEAPAHVRAVMIASNALCFAIAAIAGGYLVGRFGGRAGRREAAVSGLLAAAVAWAIALAQAEAALLRVWIPLLVILAALGSGASFFGGHLGVRSRVRNRSSR